MCVQFICVQGSAFTAPSHGIRHPWAGGDDGAVVESVGTSQRLQTSLIVSLGEHGGTPNVPCLWDLCMDLCMDLWNSNHPNMVGMNVYDIADLR